MGGAVGARSAPPQGWWQTQPVCGGKRGGQAVPNRCAAQDLGVSVGQGIPLSGCHAHTRRVPKR